MGRQKLEAAGIKLPLLPLSCAGALPKQPELAELRYKVAKGVQQKAELERKEKLSMEVWLREQERVGLDVLVDGEMDRSDLIKHFAGNLSGFERGGMVRVFANQYYEKPILRSKVEWTRPVTVETWRLAQRMTHRPVKAVVSGPYTLADWSFDEFYGSREAACRDIAGAVRREIAALIDAGARVIQIDELALSARPEEFDLVADGIREITRDFRAYFILHHAFGDVAPVWKKLTALPVDQLSFESISSDFGVLELLRKYPTAKDVGLGLVDPLIAAAETTRTVGDRLRECLRHVAPSRLWVTTGTGLKIRNVSETVAKLKALAASVEKQRIVLK